MTNKLAAAVVLALAVALVVPAGAAMPRAGSWSGSTDQNRSISFTVAAGRGKVKEIEFGYRGRCDNGAGAAGTVRFAGKYRVSEGEFTARGPGGSVVTGEFRRRKKAIGTLQWRGSYFDPVAERTVACQSATVGWTARR